MTARTDLRSTFELKQPFLLEHKKTASLLPKNSYSAKGSAEVPVCDKQRNIHCSGAGGANATSIDIVDHLSGAKWQKWTKIFL